MNTLLVTGGAGFIGVNFVKYWLRHYPDDMVVVLDSLTYAGNLSSLEDDLPNPNLKFIHGDICDAELVEKCMAENSVDIVVNFAAESHVDRSIAAPSAFVQTNIHGTYVLLEAARNAWLSGGKPKHPHRFHHISTDEVYGSLNSTDSAFSELTPYAPSSPYSASKAASDHLVRAYHHTYGLNITMSNCSNNYGPYQFPEKLIPLMIINCLAGKRLPVYGDGTNIRDWIFVADHIRGIDLVLKKGRIGESYNIGGNAEYSNIDVVRKVCATVDSLFDADPKIASTFPDCPALKGKSTEALIQFVEDRPGHDWRYAIDASKAHTELGFQPQTDFDTGLTLTVKWMFENQNWCQSVLDDSYRDWMEQQYTSSVS